GRATATADPRGCEGRGDRECAAGLTRGRCGPAAGRCGGRGEPEAGHIGRPVRERGACHTGGEGHPAAGVVEGERQLSRRAPGVRAERNVSEGRTYLSGPSRASGGLSFWFKMEGFGGRAAPRCSRTCRAR